MKATLKFRSVVFQRAYIIAKQTGCTFSEALKAAWERYRNFKAQKVEELTKRISGFDFFYCYSDDRRTYSKWSRIQDEIRNQLSTLPGSFISAIASHFQQTEIRLFI